MARETIEAKDLASALRALGAVDRDAKKEAVEVLRGASRKVQTVSQARMQARPGGGTYPRRKGMVGRYANQKGAGTILKGSRYPWAWGAEFGAKRAWLPRGRYNPGEHRKTIQGKLRRRQFPVWRGSQHVMRSKAGPGWIILPTIRKLLPEVERDLQDELSQVFYRAMRQQGVGRG